MRNLEINFDLNQKFHHNAIVKEVVELLLSHIVPINNLGAVLIAARKLSKYMAVTFHL